MNSLERCGVGWTGIVVVLRFSIRFFGMFFNSPTLSPYTFHLRDVLFAYRFFPPTLLQHNNFFFFMKIEFYNFLRAIPCIASRSMTHNCYLFIAWRNVVFHVEIACYSTVFKIGSTHLQDFGYSEAFAALNYVREPFASSTCIRYVQAVDTVRFSLLCNMQMHFKPYTENALFLG